MMPSPADSSILMPFARQDFPAYRLYVLSAGDCGASLMGSAAPLL